ncbi:MAG: endolytic transglycosylase MltG [Candidatus Pacebacteria bacterium]|nr:endolytic transglycosylase MltG [Candidatus Paceibacterota bacterium]
MYPDNQQSLLQTGALPTIQKKKSGWFLRSLLAVLVIGGVCLVYVIQAPSAMVNNTIVTIKPGMSVTESAHLLSEKKIIRSSALFLVWTQISNKQVTAGDYIFEEKETMLHVAQRMSQGDYGNVRIRIVIPEGSSNMQIANILAEQVPNFNREEFLAETATQEGYLYPDTYFIFPSTSTQDIITLLENAFEKNKVSLQAAIDASPRSFGDIVIMASIVEKEATNDPEQRAIIAGILWKRIDRGMPLQVDAPFLYAIGKGSHQLSTSDLRQDSPYNTYTNKGLTPTPIGNPSLGSLQAALSPRETPYLFYLHGSDQKIYYARTHDEHVNNKQKYLR